MSAETLRRAASLMRERVADATPGPWLAFRANKGLHAVYGVTTDTATDYESDVSVGIKVEDAEHIASWHPAVALAVANWLEDAAENLEMQAPGGDLRKNWDMRVHIAGDRALAVACAYLGDS